MKAIAGLIALVIVMPIWLYLLYKILVAVDASELMFFLYWIYVPVVVISNALVRLADGCNHGR